MKKLCIFSSLLRSFDRSKVTDGHNFEKIFRVYPGDSKILEIDLIFCPVLTWYLGGNASLRGWSCFEGKSTLTQRSSVTCKSTWLCTHPPYPAQHPLGKIWSKTRFLPFKQRRMDSDPVDAGLPRPDSASLVRAPWSESVNIFAESHKSWT